MIVVYLGYAVDAATWVLFYFGPGVIVALGRRGLRDAALVGVNVVVTLATLLTAFLRALGERGERDQQTKC